MKPLVLAFASLLSASTVWATPVPYKDWMTEAATDEIFVKDACLAATNVAVGTNRAQLLLSFTKDRATVPQLVLKVWDQTAPEAQLLIKTSSKTSYPLFLWKASTQPAEPSIYWYAPIGWSPLMDYIAAANTLSVLGATTKLEISLKGSAVSLGRTAECLKADEILPLDFLKKLNAKTETAAATYANVDEMIQGNEKAFETYRLGLAKTKELADLRKGSAKLLGQETEALEIFNNASKRWQSGTDALNVQLATQKQLQETLSKANSDLQVQQTELPVAQADSKNKLAIYEPVRKQFAAFTDDMTAKQNALNKNIKEVKNLQARIAELEGDIPAYRAEASRLQNYINNISGDVDSARRNYRNKQDDADRYNVDSEYRSELFRDFQYSDYVRDAENARREADRYENEARREESAKRSAEADLRRCKEKPENNCSSAENAVREHDRRADDAKSKARSKDWEAESKKRDAESRASSIRRKIEDKKRDLESEASSARSRYNSLQNDLDTAQSRLNSINNALPSMRDDLAYSRDQLPKAQAERPALEQALAAATQAREDARKQLDHDRIKSEYEASVVRVQTLQKGIADNKALITKTENSLKKIKPVIDELTKDLALKTQKRDQAAAKLAPIQEALKPFRAQEAAIMQSIADLAGAFEQGKARYQRSYESWIAPVNPTAATWSTMMSIGTF